MFFNFLTFFAIIFEFSNSSRVETDRNEKNFFPFFGLSRPVSAVYKAWMMFFNFLNFVAIIFEFSNSGRVETDWNEKKILSIFQAVPTRFS